MQPKQPKQPKEPSPYPEDLQHRDWLIKSTLKRIQLIDTNISFVISNPTPQKKVLVISDIREETLPKLNFLTNTDSNNNYGHVEAFKVYFANDRGYFNIPVPGIDIDIKNAWESADIAAFEAGEKNMFPFLNPFLDPVTGTKISVSEHIDIKSAMIPWGIKTFGKRKEFRIIFNPGSYGKDV